MSRVLLASIPATKARVVRSVVANQDYLISVALPFGFTEHSCKTYPVIYVLNANLYFGLVVDMVRAMNMRVAFCNELPDAFIVSISYPVTGSLAEMLHQVMHLRLRDFSPVRDAFGEQFIQEHFPIAQPPVSGSGGPFLQFIQQELMPMIESAYRADPTDRTLLGHCWDGDFALYTLFRAPHLFQRYVVASPGSAFADEETYLGQQDTLPVRLHLVTEAMDEQQVAGFTAFVARLERRQDPALTLTHRILPNSTHCAMVAPAFQAGLVAVFS